MQISLITDEISADPETAFELGLSWGVRDFELRCMDTQRVPLFSDYQKDRLKELIDEFGVRIVAISPGLFKCPFPSEGRPRFALRAFDQSLYQQWRSSKDVVRYHQEELLPLSLEFARDFGAGIVVIFSFQRGDGASPHAPDELLEILHGASQQAVNAGVLLAIEVENQFWADTGQHAADIIRKVGHPGLCVNWDPANAYEAGDLPYPSGYQAVRDYVRHVHFKDARRDASGKCIYVTHGDIDWDGQIQALQRDRYAGFISVETHMQPKIRSANDALLRLHKLIGSINPPPDDGVHRPSTSSIKAARALRARQKD
jgi:sugar phosphate isomerase/epimerase